MKKGFWFYVIRVPLIAGLVACSSAMRNEGKQHAFPVADSTQQAASAAELPRALHHHSRQDSLAIAAAIAGQSDSLVGTIIFPGVLGVLVIAGHLAFFRGSRAT